MYFDITNESIRDLIIDLTWSRLVHSLPISVTMVALITPGPQH